MNEEKKQHRPLRILLVLFFTYQMVINNNLLKTPFNFSKIILIFLCIIIVWATYGWAFKFSKKKSKKKNSGQRTIKRINPIDGSVIEELPITDTSTHHRNNTGYSSIRKTLSDQSTKPEDYTIHRSNIDPQVIEDVKAIIAKGKRLTAIKHLIHHVDFELSLEDARDLCNDFENEMKK